MSKDIKSVSVTEITFAAIHKIRDGDVAKGEVILQYETRSGGEVEFRIPYDTIGTPDGLELSVDTQAIQDDGYVRGFIDAENEFLFPPEDVIEDAKKTLSHYIGHAAGHTSASPYNDGWLPE